MESLEAKITDLNFSYTDPEKNFDRSRVKGMIARLIHVNDLKYATALEVTAGGKLFNVIVDTEITGKQLIEKGELKKRITIIPLNKIANRTIPDTVIAAAEELVGVDKVSLGLTLIGFDEELQSAMNFVFGNTFICEDSNSAKQIAFDKQTRSRSVTVDGDVYDPAGTLTGGSRGSASASILKYLSDINETRAKLLEHEKQLSTIEKEIQSMQSKLVKYKQLKQQWELKDHEKKIIGSSYKSKSSSHASYKN